VLNPVTSNAPCGFITTVSLTLTSHNKAQFVVNNNYVSETSIVLANVVDYAGAGSVMVSVRNVRSDAFDIIVSNTSGNTLTAVCKIGYLII